MEHNAPKPSHVVIMGVAGCGKSTVGAALAKEMELTFVEGDDYHLDASVQKMASGESLIDADRLPWLAELNKLMCESKVSLLISCSALKAAYRDILADSVELTFVYIDITPELALQRVSTREHFFPTSLVTDQFDTLEVPKRSAAIWCDATGSIELIVATAHEALSASAFVIANADRLKD